MKPRPRPEAADDARRSYDEAIAALREKHIRAHAIRPRDGNVQEQAWWDEGSKGRGPGDG